jgi:hypothetical protein
MVDSPADARRLGGTVYAVRGLPVLLAMPAKRPFPERRSKDRFGPKPSFTLAQWTPGFCGKLTLEVALLGSLNVAFDPSG